MKTTATLQLPGFLKSLRWLALICACLLITAAHATVRRVDSASNAALPNGISWATAYSNLQAAIDAARSGDEIWIAKGTYQPGSGASFQMRSGVSIYGGFTNTMTQLSQRNWVTNKVILKGNNASVIANTNLISGTLDGVTIINGSGLTGGGMNNTNSSFTINNVIIEGNTAQHGGGGIYNINSSPNINNVSIRNNTSVGDGGGIFNNSSSPNITNTVIEDNIGMNGAGICNQLSTVTINNTTIRSNTSSYTGGGISNNNSSLTINNSTIESNDAQGGGGIYNSAYSSSGNNMNIAITKVLFKANQARSGGGIFNDGENTATCTIVGSVLTGNRVTPNGSAATEVNGGGIYNNRMALNISNTAFEKNILTQTVGNPITYRGAGIYIKESLTSLTNCTFSKNSISAFYSTGVSQGTAIYNDNGGGYTTTGVNCIFWGNTHNIGGSSLDPIYDNSGNNKANFTYSYLQVGRLGTGNVNGFTSPFINDFDAIGTDNVWMTADDGLQLSLCNGTAAIDKGNNAAISLTTDITGRPRKRDVDFIPNGGSGTAPVVDMGAYESQASLASLPGTIGNSHTIPAPQEKVQDFVTSVIAPEAGTTTSWQKKENGTTSWVTAGGLSPADSIGLRLPVITLADGQQQKTIYYRRIVRPIGCSMEYSSDSVAIRVVRPNGVFHGKIISKNGHGIKDDTVIVKHWPGTTVSGANPSYTYYGISNAQGNFRVDSIYYGDPSSGFSKDSFDIQAVKFGHNFDPPAVRMILESSNPLNTDNDIQFKDTTVLSVTGRTFQICSGCIIPNQNCPIDSVRILKDTAFYSTTGFIDTAYGRYSVAVDNPGTVKVTPQLTGHVFSPAFKSLNVQTDTSQNFQDITTHKISGYLRASCGEYIGTATLEFSDVLPKNADGTARISCFKKRVTTTAGSGYYEIALPARKYSVRLVPGTFSNTALAVQVEAFFNNGNYIPADSLIRDISRNDTTLNLIYERPPVISIISGLNDTIKCNGTPRGFVLMEQFVPDSFRVKVFQGSPVANINGGNGCPVIDTSKLLMVTNVPSINNTNLPAIRFVTADTGVMVRLSPGSPNTIGPEYLKSINLQFTDKYGRATSILKKVLVTGVRGDEGANFLTLPPISIPLLVLHDPPGDASNSTWETSQATQTALRIYAAKADEENAWAEVKLGTKLTTGIAISAESEVWGTVGGEITSNTTNTRSTEKILSTTYHKFYETSDTPDEVGADGDVYVGMALNMVYTTAKEVRYKNCAVSDTVTVIFANGGPPSEFRYSEKHLKTVIIPKFEYDAGLQPTQEKKDSVLEYAKSWQKVIENNRYNKEHASGNQPISFSGGGSGSGGNITRVASESETVEFTTYMDKAIALAAGFEVAGSGASAGGKVTFKTEKGRSENTTNTTETKVGYTLRDATSGDGFFINVRTDQVYGTPVFELTAGQSSCPPEPGTQPRDNIEVSAPISVITDTNNVNSVEFKLFVGNNSAVTTDASRTFKVKLRGSSNGATVSIDGYAEKEIPVLRGRQEEVRVRVTKHPNSEVYSYRDLEIVTTDMCSSGGGDRDVSTLLSALFVSPCSSIKMTFPENGWVLSAANYIQQVQLTNYDTTKLSSVTLQYAAAAGGTWTDGPVLLPADMGPNGTAINWNTFGLADGTYKIRLKLVCPSGTVYSESATGVINRVAPELYGQPTPTDDNYVNGDVISFSYTKKLNTTNLNTGKVTMTRIGGNINVPVTVTGYENRIVIVPVSSISGYVGETIRVIVKDITDEYGNVKLAPDTSYFLVGTTTVATGTNVLTVSITTPVVYKNSDSVISIRFKRPVADTTDVRVNYTVSGTAIKDVDYTIAYDSIQPTYAYHNGSQGAISIGKNALSKVLRIIPLSDTAFTADKTITISLSQSGNYGLGAVTTATGTITSLDSNMSAYTFIGNGGFHIRNNWANKRMPLTRLTAGRMVYINPSGECTLSGPLTLMPGSMLKVQLSKKFIVQGKINQP